MVDNCFCTPVLQRPLEFGVDAVIHSATKYSTARDVCSVAQIWARRALIREVMLPVLRTSGPSLSPFNAWVLLKGLETLGVRMRAQCAPRLQLARWLEGAACGLARAFPGLEGHPQARTMRTAAGVAGACRRLRGWRRVGGSGWQRARAWAIIDRVRLMSITANLGDTRTTITHPATTTHGRLSAEARGRAGIRED